MQSKDKNRASSIGLLVAVAALIVLAFAFTLVLRLPSPLLPASQTAIGTAFATPGGDLEFPTDYPPEKQTYEVAVLRTQQALMLTITPEPPPTGRPPTNTPSPFIPGIYDTSIAPFGVPQAYAMANRWQDIVNGERTIAYAGARKDTSGATPIITQGLIVVAVYSTDLINRSIMEYEAPGETGILRITSVDGYRLTLSTQIGATLYFDVPTRQFVDSLTATITAPTTTPMPTSILTAVPPTGYPPPPSEYPQTTLTP